jgi:hypothetical protein
MTQVAVIHGKSQAKLTTFLEMQAKHLTVLEFNLPKNCIPKFRQTQVAINKLAFYKLHIAKVCVREIAAIESTSLVFAFNQWIFSEIDFIE